MPFELLIGHTLTIGPIRMGGKILDVDRCKENLTEKHNQARAAIQKAQVFLQKRNIRKRGCRAYKPHQEEDQVWLDSTNITTLHPFVKLEPKRYGPFPVTKVISDIVFKLKLPYQWLKCKVHPIFHASLLSPYKEMEEHGPNFLEPPPEVVEGEEEYEVEAILDDKTIRRKHHYLIKWKGYTDTHNSWEPNDQVHADDLVREYNNKKEKCAWGIRLRRT
jgi:Chromo (CHRromatin Organisation MOdifier) domain